jgi:hypothetical protein
MIQTDRLTMKPGRSAVVFAGTALSIRIGIFRSIPASKDSGSSTKLGGAS